MILTEDFWEKRYKNNNTGWDLGVVSPPLKTYFDQLENKNIRILIPGGGNSYEAEYLHTKGFKNVFVVDVSKTALTNLKSRVPSFPPSNLILKDFFNLDMVFDLIIEQTFFCAIDPNLRPAYAIKAYNLLKEQGKVVGLLFDIDLNKDKPPFGGCKAEYIEYFQSYFDLQVMENCNNSISSRKGTELFFIIKKKKLDTLVF